MRIAISGAYCTGKTTLVGELGASLPSFDTVDEPYRLLEREGYSFAKTPFYDDVESQFERSIRAVVESGGDRMFDRWPPSRSGALPKSEPAVCSRIAGKVSRQVESVVVVSFSRSARMKDPDGGLEKPGNKSARRQ